MATFSSHHPYHPLLLVDSASPAPSASCFPYNSSVNQPNAFPISSDLAFLVEAQLKMNSPSVEEDSPASAGGHTVGKRRKSRDCTSSDSAQLKDAERKSRKQRKHDEGGQAAATGYIHVRARRGQATDSHSLAERVRREKIRERMNLLQGLVPGCDKITGKALMLDEIINYVQSLQNQVEFLSMKLASVNPLFHNCGLDPQGQMDQTQKMVSIPQESLPIPPVLQNTAPMHHIAIEESPRNYRMVETPSALVMHGQGAIALTQDNGSFLMQVADRRQGLLNQVVFHNMCSFHPAE